MYNEGRSSVLRQRVFITGMGCVTPLGCDLSETLDHLRQGKSGISGVTSLHEDIPSRVVGRVDLLSLDEYVPPKEQKRMDRFIHLAMVAGQKAWRSAGLSNASPETLVRMGVISGVGFGGLGSVINQTHVLHKRGPRRVSPYFIPMSIANLASGFLGMKLGIKGDNFAVSSACASSAHAVGEVYHKIRCGLLDGALVGGSESALVPLAIAAFSNMKALSTRYNETPHLASRPFDRDRDGFVIAEGAGYVVLESEASVRKRQAQVVGELLGYGVSSDAYHLTQPAPEGEGGGRAMQLALEDGALNPECITHVNAHGTSTPTGDELELMAIAKVLGEQSAQVYVSSTKSMTGHMLGAAGCCELIFSLISMKDGFYPPTINLTNPVESYGLQLVGPDPVTAQGGKCFMTNSFGFGGTNAVLIVDPHPDV